LDERGKISVFEREIAAWNRGDLRAVIAELDGDHEWDVTRSDIPGETEVHRGHDAYLGFARRWREALGSTQLEIVEVKECPTADSSPSSSTRESGRTAALRLSEGPSSS
jgi:hypothetical protein